MAAAAEEKKHPKKVRNTRRRSSFLCSFGACFGISNKVSADHGKSVTAQFIPPSPELNIVTSSKEIHIVEDDDDEVNTNSSVDQISIHKRGEIKRWEKKKSREESNPIRSRSSPTIKRELEKQKSSSTWQNQRNYKLSHSVFLPQQKQAAAAAKKKGKKGKEFDSTVGAVMMSVTLVVMMIWGKVWAVLCTAAWFYLLPRFRAKLEVKRSSGESESESEREEGVDLDSWEYKNKVVLQGLLHRNIHK